MPVAVLVVEATSLQVVELNDAARRLAVDQLGLAPSESLIGQWEICHPDGTPYATAEWPVMRSLDAGEEVIDEEYFHVLPDGNRLIICCSSAPIYDDGGGITAAVLVMEDISEYRRVHEELRYHASLLDIVEDGVIATDAEDFLVTAWNRGAERLYGYTAAESLGQPAREIGTYEGDPSRPKLERELAETGRSRTEFTARRKDGTPVEVELIAVAVKDDGGELAGYLGVHRDITERTRLQAHLLEAQELERSRIARALHDEPLQALADALALAMAAHRAAPSGPAEQLVPVLRRASEQLRAAIYDLRQTSTDTPFAQALEELVQLHRGMVSGQAVSLAIEEESPLGTLGREGAEFLRILGEALTNVRRHAQARNVEVRVWTREGSLWAEVSDDGRGFDPTGPQPPEHHGIRGMHERAELLGGRVEIRSVTGAGATVRVQAGRAHGGSETAKAKRCLT